MSSHPSDSHALPPGSHPTAGCLDARLRSTSTIFYVVGIAIVLVVANSWRLTAPSDRLVLNVLAGLGLASAALQRYFPWHRFHRNLLLVNTFTVIGLVSLLVAYSGGAQSPFASYYFMITVFAALYFDRPAAVLSGALVALASLIPLLHAHNSLSAAQLLLAAPIHLSVAITGQMMAAELMRQREQQTVLARELARASESHAVALEAARTDGLTQLRNRAALSDEMGRLIAEYRASGRPFSLLFLDIDHFKALNDHYGHACGDDVLRQVATLMRSQSRSTDLAARYGGDEFVLVLPDAPVEIALRLAERLRAAVEQHRFWTTQSATRVAVTISVGAAAFPDDGATVEDLIFHADASMYVAKRAGRNQARRRHDDRGTSLTTSRPQHRPW